MVSIIVPIYNVEKYLKRCIESILRQSMQELEIILVDDGSVDASAKICDEYQLKDHRIKVIHQNNMGQVEARNAGIVAAHGDYIGFVDSDDWIEYDMISTLYEKAVLNDADIVMEGMIEEAVNEMYCCRNALAEGVYCTDEAMNYLRSKMISCEDYFKLGIQPYLWNKLFRTELVKNHMLSVDKKIRVGEDAAAVYTMIKHAKCVVLLSSCHYHYCLRNSSVMAGMLSESEELESAKALYHYLSRVFMVGNKVHHSLNINRYIVNVLLTRIYGNFVIMRNNSLLFPFRNIVENDTVIIYGAGALGKAVYRYVSKCERIRLKGWTDGRYEKYQRLGLPVVNLDTIDIEKDDKILVAVFDKTVFKQIKDSLLLRSIREEQIVGVEIGQEEEMDVLRFLLK